MDGCLRCNQHIIRRPAPYIWIAQTAEASREIARKEYLKVAYVEFGSKIQMSIMNGITGG